MTTPQIPRTSLVGSVKTESTPVTVDYADPRSRSAQSWAATKAVMASRGEVDGPGSPRPTLR